jgi:hypothetical protein
LRFDRRFPVSTGANPRWKDSPMSLGDLIRAATPADAGAIAALLAAAHAESPIGRWLAQDPEGDTPIEWDAIVAAALADPRNPVHIFPDAVRGVAGVAVWYDHHTGYPPTVGFGVGPVDSRPPHTSRLGLLQACIGSFHPDEVPHHHLGYLAVDAALKQRSRDIASALLDYHHMFLDVADLAAFTVTGDEEMLAVLVEHRYRSIAPISPAGAPSLHPAWRARKSTIATDSDEQ